MGVKLVSSGGGSVEINPPATASSFIATMPAGTGNVVVNNVNSAIVAGTAVASTSGTFIDFTGIPSWVRRITVMFNGVSTNGTSALRILLGDSGGFENTGYAQTALNVFNPNGVGGGVITNGFGTFDNAAAAVWHGALTINLLSGNTFVTNGGFSQSNAPAFHAIFGSKTLSDTLTQVRITTVNGTDTFDAGSINILYE